MKVVFILAFFLSNCFAQTCSELSIELIGEVVLLKKENGKTKKDIHRAPFPKNWNANSDRFASLYLANGSSKKLSEVLVEFSSPESERTKESLTYSLKEKSKLLELENSNFKEQILSKLTFPAKMKLSVLGPKKEKICAQRFSFEVIP